MASLTDAQQEALMKRLRERDLTKLWTPPPQPPAQEKVDKRELDELRKKFELELELEKLRRREADTALNECLTEKATLEKKNQDLKKAIEKTKKCTEELEQCKKDKAELERQLNDAQEKKKKDDESIEDLRNKLRVCEEQQKAYEIALNEQKDLHAANDGMISALTNQITTLESQLESVRKELADCQQNARTAADQESAAVLNLSAKTAELAAEQTKNTQLAAEQANLTNEIAESRKSEAELRAQLEKEKQRIKTLEEEVKNSKISPTVKVEPGLEQKCNEEIARLTAALDAVQNKLYEKIREITRLETELNNYKTSANRQRIKSEKGKEEESYLQPEQIEFVLDNWKMLGISPQQNFKAPGIADFDENSIDFALNVLQKVQDPNSIHYDTTRVKELMSKGKLTEDEKAELVSILLFLQNPTKDDIMSIREKIRLGFVFFLIAVKYSLIENVAYDKTRNYKQVVEDWLDESPMQEFAPDKNEEMERGEKNVEKLIEKVEDRNFSSVLSRADLDKPNGLDELVKFLRTPFNLTLYTKGAVKKIAKKLKLSDTLTKKSDIIDAIVKKLTEADASFVDSAINLAKFIKTEYQLRKYDKPQIEYIAKALGIEFTEKSAAVDAIYKKLKDADPSFDSLEKKAAQIKYYLENIERLPDFCNPETNSLDVKRINSHLYEPLQDVVRRSHMYPHLEEVREYLGLDEVFLRKIHPGVDMSSQGNLVRYLHTLSVIAGVLASDADVMDIDAEIERCYVEWPPIRQGQVYDI